MTSTQVLLGKIAALRQRLAHGEEAAAEPGDQSTRHLPGNDPVQALERKVTLGSWHNALLEYSLRNPDTEAGPPAKPAVRLTARSARLLQQGRGLLRELRRLADEPIIADHPLDPLTRLHRETAAMIGSVVRAVEDFPAAPSAQVRLCDGLEATLGTVAEHTGIISSGLERRKLEAARIETLIDFMQTLTCGQSLSLHAVQPLAEELLEEARQGQPLRFYRDEAVRPARFIACHSLIVAQVMARLIHADPDWAGRTHEPVLAALLHDIGMLSVPAEILAQPLPLNDEQRRHMEGHTRTGADRLRHLIPAKSWLIEAAGEHHERVDGTGYPSGLSGSSLSKLVRLLSVCDIYAALCSPRPYRPALETRTALTDTLLLAEQGALDRFQAERLLELSFYPAGAVVELSDGAIGVSIAASSATKDLRAPARPVLLLLIDGQGRFLPTPAAVDLLHTEGRSIVRSLPTAERLEVLGKRYPELV